METVNDIVKETREHHILTTAPCACWVMRKKELIELCDRLEAAYKRDLQAMCDAGEIDMRTAMGEVERLRAENERLKAALKPIIDFRPEIVGNHGEEEAWDSDLMMEAMVEARDIYNGGAK